MSSTFNDRSFFKNEDLVGFSNRTEAMGNNESRTARHQSCQTFLDQGFTLRIKAGGGLVKNENTGIGKNSAGNGHALALPSGQLDATLTYKRVQTLFQFRCELIDARDASRPNHFIVRRGRAPKKNVFLDGSIEEKVVLQNNPKLRPV